MNSPKNRQSRSYLDAIVNQWLHLGKVGWMTRTKGFTMLFDTEFGAFSRGNDRYSYGWIEDPSVGIKLRSDSVKKCKILGDPECNQIQFYLSMDSGVEVMVSKACLDDLDGPILQRIKHTFGLDGTCSSTPWLDEWDEIPEPCKNCPIACFKAAHQVANWRQIEITVEMEDLSIETMITPTWSDRDGTILRMFDSKSQQSIYIDLTTPGLSIESNSDCLGSLKMTSPALN